MGEDCGSEIQTVQPIGLNGENKWVLSVYFDYGVGRKKANTPQKVTYLLSLKCIHFCITYF